MGDIKRGDREEHYKLEFCTIGGGGGCINHVFTIRQIEKKIKSR